MNALKFVGCSVVETDVERISYPETLREPCFFLEPLGPCDGLLVTSLRFGNGENLLAVAEVPAAFFEEPPIVPLILPPLTPDVQLVISFRNRSAAPALFILWLGPEQLIRFKYNSLVAAAELKRFKPPA